MATEKATLAVLTRYKERKITRERAAAMLDISLREVNREMKRLNLERDPAPYALAKSAAEKKREVRANAARRAKAQKISVKAAAKIAGCSERTIRRFMGSV